MNGTFDVARDKVDSETGEALIRGKFGEKLPRSFRGRLPRRLLFILF